MGFLSSIFGRTSRRRVYSDLLQLDDHLLRDIGLTRSDVHRMLNDLGSRGKTGTRAHE